MGTSDGEPGGQGTRGRGTGGKTRSSACLGDGLKRGFCIFGENRPKEKREMKKG